MQVTTAIEYLQSLKAKGRGNESCHVVLWPEEHKARRERKEMSRFAIETDSHEAYMALNEAKDFVIKHCGNKAVAITMLIWAWRQLDGPTLDKLMAAGEAEG
jgi:hypothetical protein